MFERVKVVQALDHTATLICTASYSVIGLLWPYTLGACGFQPILLQLQQKQKCEVVPVLAHLPYLTVVARPSGKPGCVFVVQTMFYDENCSYEVHWQ
jgi:hypothetical protein